MMNQANLRHLTVGQNWVNAEDIVTQRYGKTTDPVTLLGQLWRIRCLPNGYYAINSIMNPHMGLSAQMIDSVHRVVVRDIGDCTADVPSEAQWMIIPCDGNWILYNVAVGKVISTTCCNCDDDVPLNMVSYSDECCVECAHWRVWNNNSPPTETVLHNDLIGWVRDTSVTVALPIGATTQFHAACYAESCNCCSGWRSSNSAVASIDSTGKVTALAAGNTTISVTMGGNYVECPVTVVEGDIAIIKYSDHAQVNGTIQLQAVTVAGNETITWSSADTEKATVDANGLVTVKVVDAVEITASATGMDSQTVTLYGVIPDGVYVMQNVGNEKCISVLEKYLFQDTTIYARDAANVAEQKWHICYIGDGKHVIRSYANPWMTLGFNWEYPNNAYVTSIEPTSTIEAPANFWTITCIGNEYILKNGSTNKVLSLNDLVVKTENYESSNTKQQWSLISTNVLEELVLYDEGNSKYITNKASNETDMIIHLEPEVDHQLQAIHRASTVLPQSFTWKSDNQSVVTVKNGSIKTCKKFSGNGKKTVVTITSNNSPDLSKQITVGVRIPVRSVELSCCMKMIIGRKMKIAPMLSPFNATPYSIKWNSSPKGIVEIDDEGNVTALSGGEATITVTVNDGTNNVAKGSIFVETRERVKIEKEGSDHFIVKFVDELLENNENDEEEEPKIKVWKSVQYDFEGDDFPYEDIYSIAKCRNKHNQSIRFTEDQLAFLFLLDPFGVRTYIKSSFDFFDSNSDFNTQLEEYLYFEDRVYEKIFSRPPEQFILTETGKKHTRDLPAKRIERYSDAELIFGAHSIENDSIIYFLYDMAIDFSCEIMEKMCAQNLSTQVAIKVASTCAKALIRIALADSFLSGLKEVSSVVVSSFIDYMLGKKIDELEGIDIEQHYNLTRLAWVRELYGSYSSIWDLEEATARPTIYELTIYQRIKEQNNYKAIFNGKVVDDIIELMTSTNN
jgi:uncharacterized protein YjdB